MDLCTKIYYDKITKDSDNSFLDVFDYEWNLFLKELDLIYTASDQLRIGNRLRPIMTCWGYMHCYDINDVIDFHYIAKVAVCLEAMHKASVIIDDVIDGDTQRRGVNCIHVDYSEHEAIFFSVCIISSAISTLNQLLHTDFPNNFATETTSLLCNTILQMCKGALLEITSTESDRINMERIKNIIDFETVTLLKNSLVIGYISSNKVTEEMQEILVSIGTRCGYIFQVMNDLEPFCNPEYIKQHKGNLNTDYFKSRKNIVIPYLYDTISKKEQEWLKSALNTPGKLNDIVILFENYKMKKVILNDMDKIQNVIHKEISLLGAYCDNSNWIMCFESFVDYLIEYCLSILDGVPKQWN